MATNQTAASAKRSEAAKKGAATRAAKAAGVQADQQHQITEEQRKGERRQQQENAVAQFTQSTATTPAVHSNPEPDPEVAKQKAFMEAVQALATSMGVQVPALSQAKPGRQPRAARNAQNGITRPDSNTTTGKIWDLADKLSADNGGNPVAIADLRAHPELRQTNENTLKTQYARWRGFHGIKGRVGPQGGQAVAAQPYTGPDRRAADPQPQQ